MKRLLVVSIAVVLLFVSCATQSVYNNRLWVSYMGTDGRTVVAAGKSVTGFGDVYAEVGSDGSICGVAKLCNIPAFAINKALSSRSEFVKGKDGTFTVYTNQETGVSLACIGSGLVFFSNGSCFSDFERLSSMNEPVLDTETTALMIDNPCAVYITDPAFIKLGGLNGFESFTAFSKDLLVFDCNFEFRDETQSTAFEKIVKAKLVSDALKEGNKPDLQSLAAKINRTGNSVSVNGVKASDYATTDFIELISSFNMVL